MRNAALCIVNGPFQALSLVASLRQLGRLPGDGLCALLVDMESDSVLQRATSSVLAQSGIDMHFVVSKHLAPRDWPRRLAAIEAEAAMAFGSIETLFTYGLHRPIARYLAHVASRARIVIYEEGLRTYVASEPSARERARLRVAGLWGLVDPDFGMAWSLPRPGTRDIAYCLLLGERLPLPETLLRARVTLVGEQALRATLSALSSPTPRCTPPAKAILIVGQYYARLKQMTRAAELAAYSAAAIEITRRGCVPIFRGHLRDDDDLFPELATRCPELRNFSEFFDDAGLPLELYASMFPEHCVGAVSFSSSALYYLRYLYGIDTCTLLSPRHIERMKLSASRGVCARSPELFSFFAQAEGGPAFAALERGP